MSGSSFARVGLAGALRLGCVTLAIALSGGEARAQLTYQQGQNVSPAFEGWEANEDGSFDLVFGYMNRNWWEELDVPVGPDNHISPGPEDQGQPTHLLPRRNRFVFKVRVPADFGDQEMVWTLTTKGKTEFAYGSLRIDYQLDNIVIASETGALGIGRSDAETRANTPPVLTVEGETVRHVGVGQSVKIVATIADDGLEKAIERSQAAAARAAESESDEPPTLSRRQLRPPIRITVSKVVALHLTWFVFRSEGEVTFDPPQVKTWEDTRTGSNSPWAPMWVRPSVPADARWEVTVTFDRPGTYVLRGRADDGALYHDQDITFIVRPITVPQ